MELTLEISNFKSIAQVKLKLAPVTVLLGPPAAGKSNVLDAIALLGFIGRHLLVSEEYGGQYGALEPPSALARYGNDIKSLFRYYDLSREISLKAVFKESSIDLKLRFAGGQFEIVIGKTKLSGQLNPLLAYNTPNAPQAAKYLLESLKERFDARVYGYDRYGLSSTSCSTAINCGFHFMLSSQASSKVPLTVLSELGWNARNILRSAVDVVPSINDALREGLGERVEVKVLRDGRVVIFDYDYEVDSTLLSEGILRILYYLLALKSSTNYNVLRGLEGRLILALEEPESHIFPFMLELLTTTISNASRKAFVVVTTHNPLFASLLGDKIQDVKLYYVYRNEYGSTTAVEIDVKALASDLKTIEDLTLLPPKEVVEKYAARG